MNGHGILLGFARQQTGDRLTVLAQEARRCLDSASADALHDLRVAMRRFTQGLILFADFLPKQETKRIRRHLKDMMRLTSEVRNRDIALEYLESSTDKELKAGLRRERARHAAEFQGAMRGWVAENFAAEWRAALELDRHEMETSA